MDRAATPLALRQTAWRRDQARLSLLRFALSESHSADQNTRFNPPHAVRMTLPLPRTAARIRVNRLLGQFSESACDDMCGADGETDTATHNQGEEVRASPVMWIWIRNQIPTTVTSGLNPQMKAHDRAQANERAPSQEDAYPVRGCEGIEFEAFHLSA